jgi:predicted unusual protein kinase regulating ubiquinone biosynthesis (AarF/ABC1/UbiB family)
MFVLCRETLTALGPSFIKAGQVLASRPDIIREDYMNELCTLQVYTGCHARVQWHAA